jgi:hypothetical protein
MSPGDGALRAEVRGMGLTLDVYSEIEVERRTRAHMRAEVECAGEILGYFEDGAFLFPSSSVSSIFPC